MRNKTLLKLEIFSLNSIILGTWNKMGKNLVRNHIWYIAKLYTKMWKITYLLNVDFYGFDWEIYVTFENLKIFCWSLILYLLLEIPWEKAMRSLRKSYNLCHVSLAHWFQNFAPILFSFWFSSFFPQSSLWLWFVYISDSVALGWRAECTQARADKDKSWVKCSNQLFHVNGSVTRIIFP